jgi:hypothetical protein
MKWTAEGILKATRRQRGRAVTQRVTDPRSLANRASREPAILRRRHAIAAFSLHQLPLCTNARALAAERRLRHRIPGSRLPPQCAASRSRHKPWKYRWAGAATPTQQNTTHPQEPPRRASDVFYGSNPYKNDNPRWVISNAAETIRVPGAAASITGMVRSACEICAAWLIGLPRRAGSWLHAATDEEARWWHWQFTERYGGLIHQYRDERFAILQHDPSIRRDDLDTDLTGCGSGCGPA